jgi:hypothetical protein
VSRTEHYALGMAKRLIKSTSRLPALREIEHVIHTIHGRRVMLDSDLAVLYGITTGRLNEQVARNPDKFPEDFSFLLTQQEFSDLISQIAISSSTHGGRRKLPRVFTEQGVAMLSSVLNSPTAVQVNIAIMRAFVRMRRLLATPGELVEQITQLADAVKLHDHQIKAIADVLERMVQQPALPKRPIGFHAADGQK